MREAQERVETEERLQQEQEASTKELAAGSAAGGDSKSDKQNEVLENWRSGDRRLPVLYTSHHRNLPYYNKVFLYYYLQSFSYTTTTALWCS